MVAEKQRLYIALYFRSGPGYHWALLVGPEDGPERARGKRYHLKEKLDTITRQTEWYYEAVKISMRPTGQLLVRIMIADVEKPKRLEQLLSRVLLVQNDPSWRCKHWVRDAILALKRDRKSLGTTELDWDHLEATANWFVEFKKRQHRFDSIGGWDMRKVPTYDILERREITE